MSEHAPDVFELACALLEQLAPDIHGACAHHAEHAVVLHVETKDERRYTIVVAHDTGERTP